MDEWVFIHRTGNLHDWAYPMLLGSPVVAHSGSVGPGVLLLLPVLRQARARASATHWIGVLLEARQITVAFGVLLTWAAPAFLAPLPAIRAGYTHLSLARLCGI